MTRRERAWLGVGVILAVVTLAACQFGETRPGTPFWILNDTEEPVTISIVRDGEEVEAAYDDPRLEPGEEGLYDLTGYPFNEQEERECTTGDIIARYDDGTEIRIPPPVCMSNYRSLSDYAPEP